jgi:hypothetical protein
MAMDCNSGDSYMTMTNGYTYVLYSNNSINNTCISRNIDNAIIPFNTMNGDYQNY